MKYALGTSAMLLGSLLTCLAEGAGLQSPHVPSYIQMAVQDQTRPEADRQRDENRKPGEVLAFSEIKPGARVLELLGAPGYYTRLLCRVVGPSGHLYAVEFKAKPPEAAPSQPTGCDNVTRSVTVASAPELPASVDVVWTTENYHDLRDDYWEGGIPNMSALNKAIFRALKPGGEFIVEDHVAEAGSGARDAGNLHRIDPELVKKEVVSVGFVYVGESHVLHHPEDAHKAKVFEMHDKTDRFLFKFRKPAGLKTLSFRIDGVKLGMIRVGRSSNT